MHTCTSVDVDKSMEHPKKNDTTINDNFKLNSKQMNVGHLLQINKFSGEAGSLASLHILSTSLFTLVNLNH